MERSTFGESWLGKLSRGLTVIGALAFALIVADRFYVTFWSDLESGFLAVNEDAAVESPIQVKQAFVLSALDEQREREKRNRDQLLNLFGSRVMFVSDKEPAYVLTEDERRYLLGSILKNDGILVEIASSHLVFQNRGERTRIDLPDPSQ